MDQLASPGINAKWLKNVKTWHKKGSWQKNKNETTQIAIAKLEEYSETGRFSGLHSQNAYNKIPTYQQWKYGFGHHIMFYLRWYSEGLNFELEKCGTAAGGVFNREMAAREFSAHYLEEILDFDFGECDRHLVPYMSMGIVLGCKEQGLRLARMRINYFRSYLAKSKFPCPEFTDVYPIFHFMLRILADYLNIEPHLMGGKGQQEPICQALLGVWRDPDPSNLIQPCLALCDFHTHRWLEDDDEFTIGQFVYTPIEILLLFKLRQLLGLENPQLDHPIMNTPLGKLPEDTPFQFDSLIQRVYDRLLVDGYDEAAIVAKYC